MTNEYIRIENWSVTTMDKDLYKAPEMKTRNLSGNVYGHPRFKDGHGIVTSDIVDVKGRVVETKSRSKYLLGAVAKEYVEWCSRNDILFDDNEPIRWRK